MPTIMALGGDDDDRPRCKTVKGRGGTRRLCPIERTESGKWKWQFESNGSNTTKSRRKRR